MLIAYNSGPICFSPGIILRTALNLDHSVPVTVYGTCQSLKLIQWRKKMILSGGADALRYHSILAGSNFKGVVVKISKHFCGF